MNAAETIAAAIRKLEDLRLDADALGRPKTNPDRPVTSALAQLGFDTLDAQLILLSAGRHELEQPIRDAGPRSIVAAATAFAEAILGESS